VLEERVFLENHDVSGAMDGLTGGRKWRRDLSRRLHGSCNGLDRPDGDRGANRGGRSRSRSFPGPSGRAISIGRTDGVTKLVIHPDSQRVLGVGICGLCAGELIAEGVLAIEMGATAQDMAMTIHPHPTLSETVMEAAEVFYGNATHVYRPKKN
jgi:hypothetical protein